MQSKSTEQATSAGVRTLFGVVYCNSGVSAPGVVCTVLVALVNQHTQPGSFGEPGARCGCTEAVISTDLINSVDILIHTQSQIT